MLSRNWTKVLTTIFLVLAISLSMLGSQRAKADDGQTDYCAHATAAGLWCAKWGKAPTGTQFQKNCLKTGAFGVCTEYTMTPIVGSASSESSATVQQPVATVPTATMTNPQLWNEALSPNPDSNLVREHPEYFETLGEALEKTCNGQVELVSLTDGDTLKACKDAGELPVSLATTIGLTLLPDPGPVNEVMAIGKLKGVVQGADGLVKIAILLAVANQAGKDFNELTVTVQPGQTQTSAIAEAMSPPSQETIQRIAAQQQVVINNINPGRVSELDLGDFGPLGGASNGNMHNKYMGTAWVIASMKNLCTIWFRVDMPNQSNDYRVETFESKGPEEDHDGPCNIFTIIKEMVKLGLKATKAGVGVEFVRRFYIDVFTQIVKDFSLSLPGDYITKMLGW